MMTLWWRWWLIRTSITFLANLRKSLSANRKACSWKYQLRCHGFLFNDRSGSLMKKSHIELVHHWIRMSPFLIDKSDIQICSFKNTSSNLKKLPRTFGSPRHPDISNCRPQAGPNKNTNLGMISPTAFGMFPWFRRSPLLQGFQSHCGLEFKNSPQIPIAGDMIIVQTWCSWENL